MNLLIKIYYLTQLFNTPNKLIMKLYTQNATGTHTADILSEERNNKGRTLPPPLSFRIFIMLLRLSDTVPGLLQVLGNNTRLRRSVVITLNTRRRHYNYR